MQTVYEVQVTQVSGPQTDRHVAKIQFGLLCELVQVF